MLWASLYAILVASVAVAGATAMGFWFGSIKTVIPASLMHLAMVGVTIIVLLIGNYVGTAYLLKRTFTSTSRLIGVVESVVILAFPFLLMEGSDQEHVRWLGLSVFLVVWHVALWGPWVTMWLVRRNGVERKVA